MMLLSQIFILAVIFYPNSAAVIDHSSGELEGSSWSNGSGLLSHLNKDKNYFNGQNKTGFAAQYQQGGFSDQSQQESFSMELRDGFHQLIRKNFINLQRNVKQRNSESALKPAISCRRRLVVTKIDPGDYAAFKSPNFPNDYGSKSHCRWRFKSTTDITVTCSEFHLQSQNKRGKCRDMMSINGNQFCGDKLKSYSGDNTITVIFKSNRRKNFAGFSCVANAASNISRTECNCGQANRVTRIVGGEETEMLEYPWQAAMVYHYQSITSVFCGASVIGSKHVLTAAHCTQAVTDYTMSYQVLIGAHSLTSPSASQQFMDALRVIQHSDYDETTFDNDIAIIELIDSISFMDSNIRPICLPNSDDDDFSSVTAIVTGWGVLESAGSQPDVLMEVDVPTMSNTQCQSYYGFGITDNMICAGFEAGGSDSCQGDSGGPLAYNSGSSYTQIGVVSWGVGCALPYYPGVYARVSKYLSWISANSASSTSCSSIL